MSQTTEDLDLPLRGVVCIMVVISIAAYGFINLSVHMRTRACVCVRAWSDGRAQECSGAQFYTANLLRL